MKLAMEEPLDRVGPLPEMRTICFSPTLVLRAPLSSRDWALLSLGWVPWGPFRTDMGHSKHINYLFSLNFDKERLQYVIVWIENGPPVWKRGEISPLSPPPLAAPLSVRHFPYLPALFYHGSHTLVDSAAKITWDLVIRPGSPLFRGMWAFWRPLASFPTPIRSAITDQHLSQEADTKKFAIFKSDKSFYQFFMKHQMRTLNFVLMRSSILSRSFYETTSRAFAQLHNRCSHSIRIWELMKKVQTEGFSCMK